MNSCKDNCRSVASVVGIITYVLYTSYCTNQNPRKPARLFRGYWKVFCHVCLFIFSCLPYELVLILTLEIETGNLAVQSQDVKHCESSAKISLHYEYVFKTIMFE